MPAANKDSLLRLITMMQMIPFHPRWVTAKSIHEGLTFEGYEISRRTVERDLNRFSTILGLISSESPEGNKWSYASDSQLSFLPALSPSEALSLKMVQQHLTHHLPPFLFTNMQALFNKSKGVLSKSKMLNHWVSKVAVVPPGLPIRSHKIAPETLNTLYKGLLENRKVRITYRNRKKEYVVALLGLIVRDNKLVFVCHYDGFTDTRMILAHRIHSAILLDETYDNSFDVQQYANSGEPGGVIGDKSITLELEVKGYAKTLLSESSIGTNQIETKIDDVWSSVSVTLPHSQELEHWLCSHINDIRILGPVLVKERVIKRLNEGLVNQMPTE